MGGDRVTDNKFYLSPNMIECGQHQSRFIAKTTAQKRKTIGIFTAPTFACQKQLCHIIVSIEFGLCVTAVQYLSNGYVIDIELEYRLHSIQ